MRRAGAAMLAIAASCSSPDVLPQSHPAARGSNTTPRFAAASRATTPAITLVTPDRGPAAGATEVTIRGSNLGNAQIALDGVTVTPLAQSATEVRLHVPAGPNGYVVISARAGEGAAYAEFIREPPSLASLRPGEITTVAGVGAFFGEGRQATRAMVEPTDIAITGAGEILIAEPGLSKIRAIRANGVIENYAGNGIEAFSSDGRVATDSELWQARGMALDAAGNLHYADAFSHRVRRIDAVSRIVTTVAGTGEAGFAGDGGPARAARLNFPVQLAFDAGGNLFVLECGNSRVRRIDPAGVITTVAGTGTPGFSGDGGPAMAAQINIGNGAFIDVGGIAVDPAGNVYVADTDNDRIRRIDRATGVITTVAQASQPRAVTTDAQGNVYFANNSLGSPQGPRIVKLDSQMRTAATFGRGHGITRDGDDATQAALGFIDRVRVERDGSILFTDFTTLRVWRIQASTGRLQTVAGVGPGFIGQDGAAIHAVLAITNGDIAIDAQGSILAADMNLHRIHRIDAAGRISSYAGNGVFGLMPVDGLPASQTQIFGPVGIHLDRDGSLLIVDTHAVRRVGADGIVRLVAGNAFREPGYAGDGGPAVGARFLQPWDVITDGAGHMYIADTNNNRIRRVDAATGVVTTIAGTGPANGWERYGAGTTCGDGGPATAACINTPYGLALDAAGNLFVAENWQRIRKIDRGGVITTLASVYATKMAIDAAGNIFAVAGSRVVRVSPQGVVTTIAGTGEPGFSGDGGPALAARLNSLGQATGIAIGPGGDLYFVDGSNRRIRVIKGGALH